MSSSDDPEGGCRRCPGVPAPRQQPDLDSRPVTIARVNANHHARVDASTWLIAAARQLADLQPDQPTEPETDEPASTSAAKHEPLSHVDVGGFVVNIGRASPQLCDRHGSQLHAQRVDHGPVLLPQHIDDASEDRFGNCGLQRHVLRVVDAERARHWNRQGYSGRWRRSERHRDVQRHRLI